MSRYHRLAQIRPDKVVGANLQRRLNFPDFFPPRVKDKDKLKRWNIFEGDKVMLISGKEKKEQGKVIEIDRDNNWVFVAGKKLVKKHQPNPLQLETPVPYRLKESGIHVSNVALLDPMDGKPCKVYWKLMPDPKSGKEIPMRFSKRSHLPLVKPELERDPKEQPDITSYDTPKEEVTRVTYHPNLAEPPIPEGVRINHPANY